MSHSFIKPAQGYYATTKTCIVVSLKVTGSAVTTQGLVCGALRKGAEVRHHPLNLVTGQPSAYPVMYPPPQIPIRDAFRVYIIPRERYDSYYSRFPTLYTGNELREVYLANNSVYSLGIQSSSHLPAEATVYIDGKYMGVIHIRPHRTFELKRNTIENKSFVFMSCDSPEVKLWIVPQVF